MSNVPPPKFGRFGPKLCQLFVSLVTVYPLKQTDGAAKLATLPIEDLPCAMTVCYLASACVLFLCITVVPPKTQNIPLTGHLNSDLTQNGGQSQSW